MTNPSPPVIESPCVLICQIEPTTGHCWGCGRTTREIGAWSVYDDATRKSVMAELPARMEALPERREKRVTRRRRVGRDVVDG